MSHGLVVDTSALIAILEGEPEGPGFRDRVLAAPVRRISAFSVLEASLVALARRGLAGTVLLDRLVEALGLEIVPLDAGQIGLAREGWERFGRGRHRAGLNLGDCCSYALARDSGQPLLFKGDDFPHTDVEPAADSRS